MVRQRFGGLRQAAVSALASAIIILQPGGPACAVEPGKSLDPTLIHDADEVVAFLIDEQTAAREAEADTDIDRDPYSRAAMDAPAESGYIIAPFVRHDRRGVTEISTAFTSPSGKPAIELKMVFPSAGKEAEAAIGTLQEIRQLEIKAKSVAADRPAAKSEAAGTVYSSSAGGSELILDLGNKAYLVLSSKAAVEQAVLSALAQKIPVEQIREAGGKR